MQTKEHESFLDVNKGRLLFSTIFTILLPIFTLLSPLLVIIFNFLYFPFTLIHELGHLLTTTLFLPNLNPHLEFHQFECEFCCACLTTNEFPYCWQSIIVMLAGSVSVIIFAILCIFSLFRMGSDISYNIGKYYFFFGILADLPNLLPIHPSSLGFITDGFAISTCLCQMGCFPFLSDELSYIFSLISILLVLASFFLLGTFFYRLGELIMNKFEKDEVNEPVSSNK
ncbi:MAG: hypothetical protein ACFFB5_08555 [Promethearchaeota archaeon]